MIPLFVVVQFSDGRRSRGRSPRGGRIWIPIFLLWLLLLPFAILFFPIFAIVCIFMGTNPIAGVAAGIDLLSALRGLEVDVQNPGQQIFMSIK